jgi:hypothetical protein
MFVHELVGAAGALKAPIGRGSNFRNSQSEISPASHGLTGTVDDLYGSEASTYSTPFDWQLLTSVAQRISTSQRMTIACTDTRKGSVEYDSSFRAACHSRY